MDVNPRTVRAVFQKVWPILLATAAAAAAVSLGGCGGFQSKQPEKIADPANQIVIKPKAGHVTEIDDINNSTINVCKQEGTGIRCKIEQVSDTSAPIYIETLNNKLVSIVEVSPVVGIPNKGRLTIRQKPFSVNMTSQNGQGSFGYFTQFKLCDASQCYESPNMFHISVAANGITHMVPEPPFKDGQGYVAQTLSCTIPSDPNKNPCKPVPAPSGRASR